MTSQSYTALLDQLKSVDQLLAIHGKLQSGKGRRHEQDAIHRAGVVMTVAAWQAYIEKVTAEALDAVQADIANAAPAAPTWVKQSFTMRRAAIEVQLKKFNTPNAQNTRELLTAAFRFDPWPSWTWNQGPRQWDEKRTRLRTDDWVRVRHTIAHGYPLPNNMSFLKDGGAPRLTKNLLEECLKHFKHVALKTDSALRDFLVGEYGIANPW